MFTFLERPALRAAYRARQASIRFPLLASHVALRTLLREGHHPPAEAIAALRREYEALLSRDLENVEQGRYPARLLFQVPLGRYARGMPWLAVEIPRAWWRARRGAWRDLPGDVSLAEYPAYFRRTFHWQTDGYLSRRSAELYDLAVEFVFLGCADAMRRQVIPPMTEFSGETRRRLRFLDVGCGTGSALAQIARALPGHRYFGVDLSPFYLETARERLRGVPSVTLAAENAEKLPFRDACFDVVTSVYLFHELPRRARRSAMAEMARVLRPGGLLVLEDSAQLSEASDLGFFLRRFAEQMHEPFYRDYVRDDLEALVGGAGLDVRGTERAWLSKVVTARKAT